MNPGEQSLCQQGRANYQQCTGLPCGPVATIGIINLVAMKEELD